MRQLQLYIDGQRVDLFNNESVELTQTIKNVKDLKKIFTEFSKTFAVPASKINNKIFSHYYNSDVAFGYDARRKTPATLELNNLPFKEGKISLQGVDLKNNLAHTYRITFFGNTVNLKDILGDDTLSTLPFAGLNTLYRYSNVVAELGAAYPADTKQIIVPFITHTNRLLYDTSNPSMPEKTNNLADAGAPWNQFKYAIRVNQIIKEIELHYPEINFSDDFFNDTSNEKFYRLFMWLHRKSGSVEPVVPITVIQNKISNLVNTNPAGSPAKISSVSNGVITVGSTITATAKTMRANFIPTNTALAYTVQVIRSGTLVTTRTFVGTQINVSLLSAGQFINNRTYQIQISCPVGVTFNSGGIELRLNWEIPGIFGNTNPVLGTDTYENNSINIIQSTDFEFNINEQIPNIKTIDFLSGIFNMFNLVAYIDNLGIIVVKTLNSYYEDSPTLYNIDEYLDTKTSTSEVALPFTEINFSYKGLGTFLAKQFQQLNVSGWGSLSYTLDGSIYDAPSEPYKIELPFEHMMYELIFNTNPGLSPNPATAMQYGYCVNENRESYVGSPLLFYPEVVVTSATKPRIFNTQGSQSIELSTVVIPSNTKEIYPTPGNFESIHFQNELSEWWAPQESVSGFANDFVDTLFETEYKSYIESVFNLRRRMIKVTAYLPLKIYYNLRLNDKIQLGQKNYRINSLKTNLTTGKTEFELLNTIV